MRAVQYLTISKTVQSCYLFLSSLVQSIFLCNGIRWPLFSYSHQQFFTVHRKQSLFNLLILLVITHTFGPLSIIIITYFHDNNPVPSWIRSTVAEGRLLLVHNSTTKPPRLDVLFGTTCFYRTGILRTSIPRLQLPRLAQSYTHSPTNA